MGRQDIIDHLTERLEAIRSVQGYTVASGIDNTDQLLEGLDALYDHYLTVRTSYITAQEATR